MIFCGIDIGTTTTKAVVVDRTGQVLDEAAGAAPPEPGAVYWYQHFCQAMERFLSGGRWAGEEIVCSVTGQGGSFVLVDGKCQPVCPACGWTALARENTVRDLIETFGAATYYRLTGWPPHGWLAACKLKEMVDRRQVPGDTRWIATVPDFIYAQLTGTVTTDITSAQITGLADFQGLRWSPDVAAWVGMRDQWLTPVVPHAGIVAERLGTAWGKMTLVTGSHDQYAALMAAGLEKDKSVMLGTGTAWVINGRTGRPRFDDRRFLIHPGRDLQPDGYGFIVTLGQIGAGFDRLVHRLGVTGAQVEDGLADLDTPQEAVSADVDLGVVQPAADAPLSVRRYMEWAGSVVAWALERCWAGGLEKIVIAGGAMQSRFWPQVIADTCGLVVEAVDYPCFTAYGAALHALQAVLGTTPPRRYPNTAAVRTYAPRQARRYQTWYRDCQKPLLERRMQT
ncbi:MAG: FGGY-family carbohydrate kinase [Planctomycetes bacterium]|jgi:sugar (pentulose or hexulose) kinase|nr:FGGY-family carbohydrate kinase [Planctomycetota bacterium]